MAKYRMVRTGFWLDPVVSEEMTWEEKYFFLYILTNPHTTQIGIYKITKKQMAFDMGYSIETINSLMNRFIHHYQLIRYNPETRELTIKNWGKYNLHKGGKPVMDCIISELKNVEDLSLIAYVAEYVVKEEIQEIYKTFCENEQTKTEEVEITDESFDDTYTSRYTIGGQKEKEKEKEKEKKKEKQQQQKALEPSIVIYPEKEGSEKGDEKKIIRHWNQNGFVFLNLYAAIQQLLWLLDSSFSKTLFLIMQGIKIFMRRQVFINGP